MSTKRFIVALSFPGEKRDFIRQIADLLATAIGKERVLYDDYLTGELARPNLDVYLGNLYRNESELLVPFFCADYEKKEWCGIESRQIRDILKQKRDDHIMPFRFDDAPVTGVLSIDGYVKIADRTPNEIADLILKRINTLSGIMPEEQPRLNESRRRHISSNVLPRFLFALIITCIFAGMIYHFSQTAHTARPHETNIASPSSFNDYPSILQFEAPSVFPVEARGADWQPSDVSVINGQRVTVSISASPTNSWSIYGADSPKGYSGPKGYVIPAGPNFKFPGAPEGCLLMRLGDGNVAYWTNNNETKIVTTPGRISFMANDDTNHQGNELSPYADNYGHLLVKMSISNFPTKQ